MRHGFVKVAAVTPDIRVADVAFNKEQIFAEGLKKQKRPERKNTRVPGTVCDRIYVQ